MKSKLKFRKTTIILSVLVFIFVCISIGLLVGFLTKKCDDKQDATETPTTPAPTSPPDLRLPRSIIPIHYDLHIEANHNENKFHGEIEIKVKVEESTNIVKLHSHLLTINNKEVTGDNGNKLNIKSSYDSQKQFFIIELVNGNLEKNKNYLIKLTYNGSFEGKSVGFYKGKFKINNKISEFSATKFEPTYARQAFPCFDEPNFKVTFNLSLTHDKELIALSNMPQFDKKDLNDTRVKTYFTSSKVPMSTYLIAFAIGQFDYSYSESTSLGNKVRVFSRPDQVNNTKYALQTTVKVLNFYENYFGIKYNLSKLDLIGLPEFPTGAMENWGLIGFRENYLLFDEQLSSSSNKKRIAFVVSHELSHNWFGNLVTMDWWNDLWLNEGFAAYIEYKGVTNAEPDWNAENFFLVDDLQPVLRLDSLENSHPIIQEVHNPDQITELFDTISYSKGSSVLRMLEHTIGSSVFQKGIQNYLKKNSYKNAKSEDLWNEINLVLNQNSGGISNVNEFMASWTKEKNFPIINVERKANEITVKQNLFIFDRNVSSTDVKWIVPLKFNTSNGNTGDYILKDFQGTIQFNSSKINWIKFNPQQFGYYIVNYTESDWKSLTDALVSNFEQFSPSDRSNLLFDSFLLAEANRLNYSIAFDLLLYVKNENHFIPWTTASTILTQLNSLLSTSTQSLFISELTKSLSEKVYRTIGWEYIGRSEESLLNKLLREKIINLACLSGNQECLNEASNRFSRWIKGDKISSDIRGLVYKYGMQQSVNVKEWEFMLTKYMSESNSAEKSQLLVGLTSVRNVGLLQRLVSYVFDENKIKKDDIFDVLLNIAQNDVGTSLVWNFIQSKWEILVDKFTLNSRNLGRFVSNVCSRFTTEWQLAEVENFFKKYPNAGAGESSRKQTIDKIKKNVKWFSNSELQVNKWLVNYTSITKPWINWRLDDRIKPIHYEIYWNIDLKSDKFDGNVTIHVETEVFLDYFVVHSKSLQITDSQVFSKSNESLTSSEKTPFAYDLNEFWIVPLKSQINPGQYKLYFEFGGNLSVSLLGLYKSVYQIGGINHSLAITQFQSTYARRAFPCFDEPEFKATFQINVFHDSNLKALSNMPVETTEADGGKNLTKFFKTEIMSTYLLALAVGDFECKENQTKTLFRVCSTPDQVNNIEYALLVGPEILSFYENLLGIDYPLPKMDLISIPDFRYGAMENWGLITFRETALLYDEKKSTLSSKMRICSIIAHEIAHMWFGDLVTMKWWEHAWLNEGFATFMSYKAVDHVESKWNYKETFAISDLASAFNVDSTPKSHQIINPVYSGDDVAALFDTITYSKGASLLRMLESAIGSEIFLKGIKNYLSNNKYQNTLTSTLFDELSLAHPQRLNVSQLMNNWVNKKGFPCVTVTRKDNTNELTLTQERFFKDSSEQSTSYLWSIPLSYYKSLENETFEFISQREQILTINESPVKFNVKQTGFYIVNYPISEWKKWIEFLKDDSKLNTITPSDRSNLLSDAFYLARAGRLSYEIPLNLSRYLIKEKHYIPWRTAQTMFNQIKKLTYNDLKYAYNDYIKNLVGDLYNDVGWNDISDTNDLHKQLRIILIDLACGAGIEDCLDGAKKLFNEYKTNNDSSKIPPNLKALVFHYAIYASDDISNIDFLWEEHNKIGSTAEKMQILQGIASSRNESQIKKLLSTTFNENIIRSQDFFAVLSYIASNPDGLPILWEFYQENYEKIVDKFTITNSNLGGIVHTMCSYFTDEKRKQEVLRFFEKYPNAGAGQNDREQAIEVLNGNIKWLNNYKNIITTWFTTRCSKQICPWNQYRLNENVIPIKYDVTFQPNVTNTQSNFSGHVTIYVKIDQEIEAFIVHADANLNITKSSVSTNDTNGPIAIESEFRYLPLEFYILKLGKKADPGSYKLFFEFHGSMANKLVGLYKSTYQSDNKTIGLAATQFEATHARKALPCFDEPRFKSIYKVKIVHEPKHKAFSNMNPINNSSSNGLITTEYNETVVMTSYLLALVVSDFECIYNKSAHGIQVGSCASPIQKHKLDYSLKIATEVIEHFTDYFKIGFPLPKVDHIAIPDFSAGAMENWGLILYRETALLYDDDDTTTASKMSICSVIAHELAHMWHGNLVTMKWWSDLWLNEGFASYMEYTAVNKSQPNWDYIHHFVINDWIRAIDTDSSSNSHPIVRQINEPSQMGYTSAIVYSKGSSMLRMLEFIMGKDDFKEGLSKYLEKHKYGNTVTQDLWNVLDEQVNGRVNITSVMEKWLFNAGFPYLNITRITSQDNQHKYKVVQQRYFKSGSNSSNDYWIVPLSHYNASNQVEIEYIETKETKEITVSFQNNIPKFNVECTGFYIVNYDPQDWKTLTKELKNNPLLFTPSDRANLIADSFYLSRAELLNYATALNLTLYLENEQHFVPWSIANEVLGLIKKITLTTEYKDYFKNYIRLITNKQFKSLNWTDEGEDNQKRLRPIIIELACFNDNKDCLEGANKEFNNWKNGQKLRPNLQQVVLKYGIRQDKDNHEDWQFLWKKYTESKSNQEQLRYLNALANTKNQTLIKRLLTYSLDEQMIAKQNFYSLLNYLTGNMDGLSIMWDFYNENYLLLNRRLGESNLASLGTAICNYFTEETDKEKVNILFSSYKNAGINQGNKAKLIEKIDENIKWLKKYKDTVGNWLRDLSKIH